MFPLEQGRNMDRVGASDPSGGADSGVFFGASVLVLVGVVQALQGLAAIANDEFFGADPSYTFGGDPTTWGWVHLGFGLLLVASGVFLFRGSRVAGIVAIGLASLSAIANFLFIPHYPFWGLVIVALEIWVIWSISSSGVLAKESEPDTRAD